MGNASAEGKGLGGFCQRYDESLMETSADGGSGFTILGVVEGLLKELEGFKDSRVPVWA